MIGKIISHYKITSEIGSGGMGIVYQAEDTILKRKVALKFLPPEIMRNDEMRKRFINEAHITSVLDHPNICNIHDIIETHEGELCIVMSCYEGKTLKTLLEERTLEYEEIYTIFKQISEGLNAAHQNGIIHRDLKPANILITAEGIVKILDFGLARILDQPQITKSFAAVGTVYYMSPEQLSYKRIDKRTDIWSLGVILYEMLAHKRPFENDYSQAIIYSILNESPAEINLPDTPEVLKLKGIIFKCLQKNPGNRYQSLLEIIEDISKESVNISPSKKTNKIIKKITALSAALIITALILAAAFLWLNKNEFFNQSNRQLQKQIAVVPFLNVGRDSANQVLCEGLIETLTSQLTQIQKFYGSVQVIPATEIRGQNIRSANDASRIFGADLAITGSIQKFNNKLRLVLNLVDAKSLRQISSSIEDYKMKNLYEFQDNAILKLSNMLEVELKPDELKQINYGITLNPDAYVYYVQGRGYLQNYWEEKNVEFAIKLFHRALEKDSNYVLALAGLSEAFTFKYRNTKVSVWLDSALKLSRLAIGKNRNISAVRATAGIILNETGRFEDALSEFRAAISLDKYNSEAYNGLALSYEHLNNLQEAERIYKHAIDLKPAYWVGYNNLGLFYYSNGNYKKASEQFKKIVDLAPDNTYGLNNLAAAYWYLEKWHDAISVFRQIIKIHPDAVTYSNMGTIYYFQLADYKQAAALFENALKLDSSSYKIWGNLASACYQIPERKRESLYYFNRAVSIAEKENEINPRDADLYSSLASYYCMLGKRGKSLQYVSKALKLAPGNIEIIEKNMETFEELGKRNEALKLAEQILIKNYPVSKLENTPVLKGLIKDSRFKELKSKYIINAGK